MAVIVCSPQILFLKQLAYDSSLLAKELEHVLVLQLALEELGAQQYPLEPLLQ